jgi:hypothetical protein
MVTKNWNEIVFYQMMNPAGQGQIRRSLSCICYEIKLVILLLNKNSHHPSVDLFSAFLFLSIDAFRGKGR